MSNGGLARGRFSFCYTSPMTQKETLSILKLGVNVFLTGEPGSGEDWTPRSGSI